MKKCLLLSIVSIVLVAGCSGSGDLGRKSMDAPTPPPAVPAVQNVPIDELLKQNATREIVDDLSSDNVGLRAHAVEAIQRVLAKEKSDDIIEALTDPQPLVRFSAAMAAGTLKLDAAKPDLLKLADDPDPSVQVAARYGLHRLGDYHLSMDLEKTAHDTDPQVRGNTALVLGLIGDPSAINVLKPMQQDVNPAVRLQVADALWRLHNNDGLQTLLGATVSLYPDEQMAALASLGSAGDRQVMRNVRGKLTADYIGIALVAARAMGQFGSDEGYGVAIKGAQSDDPRQKSLAALAFGAIGRSDAQEYLRKLLHDKDPEVRIAAATAILQLHPPKP